MRANRGKDTGPELLLRRELHRRGARYRINLSIHLDEGRRVRPDVVFTSVKVAVFVDGCFWHGCRDHRTLPASNAEFWRRKIEGTQRRDARDDELLSSYGWRVVRLWEHVPVADAAEVVLGVLAEAREANHSHARATGLLAAERGQVYE